MATILAYIDMMLLSAIKSSPHTAPQKGHNRSITGYSDYSESIWKFGIELNEEENDEGEKEGEEEGKKERDW